jgi:hypothetical protein
MTKKTWIKPELKRMVAGAAETGATGSPDGGPGGNNKS